MSDEQQCRFHHRSFLPGNYDDFSALQEHDTIHRWIHTLPLILGEGNGRSCDAGNRRMLGDRLGKWAIFKELGRGGMGRVYLAQEELTGRQAALKVLNAELAQEIGFLQRFQREIDALSQLDHPGIVRFYESGHENAMYFYAMEYVDGQSLDEILMNQGRLPWREVLDIAQQL